MNWLDFFERVDRLPSRAVPMYARICQAVRGGIESGQLPANTKLPTNRELAALLKIDRSTVSRAYLELEKAGLVESHVGRGTFVTQGASGKERAASPPTGPAVPWNEVFSRFSQTAFAMLSRQWAASALDAEVISFAGGIPTQEFFPEQEFREILSHLNRAGQSADMFSYSPSEGHPALRRQLRQYLSEEGPAVGDEELLIVSGSQQGIDLVAKTLVDPGDVVLIEEPTYVWANCIFSAAQARCVPVPVDAQGLRVDVLESVLSRHSAKLLYVMPTFQNPTGATLSMERRAQLLALARRYRLPILEDNFVVDLRYDGMPLPSLRALDADRSAVISQGTFSKALCPGLRLGWLVAPEPVMVRLRLAKRACDLSTNSLAQAVMAEYLRRGLYRRHLELVRSAYRKRRDAMCNAIVRHLGSQVRWSKPDGGLFLWAALPAGLSSRELLSFAERQGVIFSPGDAFFLNGDRQEHLRLSFIQHDEPAIEEGIARLGRALAAYLSTRTRAGRGLPALERGNEAALI
ncbi:MAG TPA: PLP-dependent aminotransferase family protein [Candidatus Obscuribacterales bacterium]